MADILLDYVNYTKSFNARITISCSMYRQQCVVLVANSESPPRAKKQIAKRMSVGYPFVLECNRIITLQYK